MTTLDPYRERVEYAPIRFLHRLNPLAKIGATLPAMGFLLFTRDIVTPLAFLALALVLLIIGAHLPWRLWLALGLGMPVLVSFMTLSFAIWVDPDKVDRAVTLLTIGDYRLYLGSVLVGLATAARLMAILTLGLLAGTTSTGPDLVRAMVQQLRVPYRIGYTALAAYRFVPRFGHELQVIRSAHRVRGMAGGRGPIAGVRRYLGYVVPLLAGAIRHAERVALAMDARAFGAHASRTERHLVPFRSRDWVFMALFLAASAAIVLFIERSLP